MARSACRSPATCWPTTATRCWPRPSAAMASSTSPTSLSARRWMPGDWWPWSWISRPSSLAVSTSSTRPIAALPPRRWSWSTTWPRCSLAPRPEAEIGPTAGAATVPGGPQPVHYAARFSMRAFSFSLPQDISLISTANITMQFGAKPLFENVSVKFGNGNRYGLIGANGCGKSTFMKILGGELEPSGGQVMLEQNVRLGKLRQDQFAYETVSVIDTVIMGHEQLWKVKAE